MRGYKITQKDVAVTQMAKLNITGNVIPPQWFQHITYEQKDRNKKPKPHATAVILLSDLVYWHRPIEMRDENTGAFVGYRKRFKGDLLQRSYNDLSIMYGFTKRQLQAAARSLQELGLVKRVQKTIVTSNGVKLSNVIFWEISPKRIEEITYSEIAITLERDSSHNETGQVSRQKETHSTETTTKTTTENERVTAVAAFSPPPLSKIQSNGKDPKPIKGKACQSNGSVPLNEMLAIWKKMFPEKPQPRLDTYRGKVNSRWKSEHFREHWREAMKAAADSYTCQSKSWFSFEFFVRNDTNYQKCLDRWMDWRDKKAKVGNPAICSDVDIEAENERMNAHLPPL